MRAIHLAGLVLAAVGVTHVISRAQMAPAPAPGKDDAGFFVFLREFERGTTRFVNGDAGPWQANASRREDVTLMGGWGVVTRGWPETGARYEFAARRFTESGARVAVEYIGATVEGDLAYTVAIERSTVRLAGQPATAPMALRVTHVFRREDGEWKLVHRHADPILETAAATSVLTR